MILDLDKFIETERPFWTELEKQIDRLENDPGHRLGLEPLKRFHYLYQHTSADLAKLMTFAAESDMHRYLESLVARAYGLIHETRSQRHRFKPVQFFLKDFPRSVRRHIRALWLAVAITLIGCLFGGVVMYLDPGAKEILLPFEHLQQSPSERVAKEEKAKEDRLKGHKTTFSAALMTNNIRVSILALAFGMTWGIGTLLLLFYNGVILGAVAFDYVMGGEVKFLLGWLLPHGSVEIPAILLAGQAGLVLANALIGWERPVGLRDRLRAVVNDLMMMIFGIALLLVWAGLIEAFFSQYHEPVIPYELKIGFGSAELILLVLFISLSGRRADETG